MAQAPAKAKRAKATTPRCGASRKSDGKPCEQAAGAGTDHKGFGTCSKHGGATESHRKAATKEEAMEFARGALGAEVTIGPLDALLQSVRLASGHVLYFATRLSAGDDSDAAVIGYERAIRLQRECSKAALDAKIDERLVAAAETFTAIVAMAAEEAIAQTSLSVKERTAFARTFGLALARHEARPPDIDGHALARAA